jgi:plasmid maintenance system killer protein
MIVQFDNKDLEDLYEGKTNRNTKKIDLLLTRKFIKTVKLLSYIENVQKLSQHDGLNFEILKGAYKGKYSVRIDSRYRLILRIENDRILLDRILIIEELTDHYKRMI